MNFLQKLLSFALQLLGGSIELLFLSTISIISLLFTLPLCIALKFHTFLKGVIFTEDVAGKVVLVTGAASGIGEQISYEYARRGARLALVDIKEDRLKPVIEKARSLGSPDVIGIGADVSKAEDCRRFVNAAVNHFGGLDHLVNNAGIGRGGPFENIEFSISELTPVMDINFWGTVYGTHFAIPHLRKSKGKIIVMASVSGWFSCPGMTLYGGSKAALIGFFESLRCELIGSDIGITIVTPGFIDSEMTRFKILKLLGKMIPFGTAEECGKAIVRSACRGDKYLVIPSWYKLVFPLKVACSEAVEFFIHHLFFKKFMMNRASIWVQTSRNKSE